jgi:F420-non-reducing hydrogenase iron-sulfur subunit
MTIKRMTFLQEMLDFIGLKGRLHLEWISSAEAQKFAKVVTEFTEKIRRLGPNPLRRLITESITRRPQPVSEPQDHPTGSTPVRMTDEFRQAKTA